MRTNTTMAKKGSPLRHVVSARATDQEFDILKRIARRRGVDLSVIVRERLFGKGLGQ